MDKKTAHQILVTHQKWRRGGNAKMQTPTELGQAIDVAIEKLANPRTKISQSIHDAAVNWPKFLDASECEILDAFYSGLGNWRSLLAEKKDSTYSHHIRTFMLFAAEALND